MVKVAIIKSFRILLVLAFAFGIVLATGQAEAQDEAFTELKPAEIIGEYAPGEVLELAGDEGQPLFLRKPWTVSDLVLSVREALDKAL